MSKENSPKKKSFSDLVRLREQQNSLRVQELQKQNEKLHRILQESESGRTFTAVDDLTQNIQALRTMVFDSVNTDREAMNELKESFEASQVQLQLRYDKELEAIREQLKQQQQSSAIHREENTSQYLAMCGELESSKAQIEALQASADEQQESFVEMENAFVALRDSMQEHVAKTRSVEHIIQALQQDVVDIEQRIGQLSTTLMEDRANGEHSRKDTLQKHEENFQQVLASANEQLSQLQAHAATAVDHVLKARHRISELVTESVANMSTRLQNDLDVRVDKAEQRLQKEQDNQKVTTQGAIHDIRTSVENALQNLRRQYDETIEKQLKSVVEKADEHEQARRAAFPELDADRVELMLSELEGAQSMLQGIAQQHIRQAHASGDEGAVDEVLLKRIRAIEDTLQDLVANPSLPPIVTIHVESQTDLSTTEHAGDQSTDNAHSKGAASKYAIAPHDFAAERDRFADEEEEAKLWRSLHRQGDTGRQTSSSRDAAAQPQKSLQSPSARQATQRSGDLKDVRARKEKELCAVQEKLNAIQVQFHELSQRERQSASNRRVATTPEAKKLSSEISRMKENVLQQERKLVEQSNSLKRELASLA